MIFVPLGGSSLALWANRLQALNRPEIHICDRDNPPPNDPKYQAHIDNVNARENCRAFCTTKKEMENYIHPRAIFAAYAANGCKIELPEAFGDFDNVPLVVAEAVHGENGEGDWTDLLPEKRRSKVSSAKKFINSIAAGLMTQDMLDETYPAGEIREWLAECQKIIAA